ncbi:MAG: hypothetical protein C4547_12235 [Phycisphaerales bacterium]|nr:MAG: hypothetical protein C4547_12235 [Phycisphaerales bacterium]
MYRFFILIASTTLLSLPALTAVAQPPPSDPVCSNGGEGKPEICVRFDNLENAPQVGTDFVFDFDDPDNPGIEFRRGSDGQISREWRVWSWDNDEDQTPKSIGTLTGNNSWNFEMKILQPDGDPGAYHLKHLELGGDVIGDHWSKVEDGQITGNLAGDINDPATFKLKRYNSAGGYAHVTIAGSVTESAKIELGRGDGFTVEGSATSLIGYVDVDITDGGIQNGNFTIEGLVIRMTVDVVGSITNGAFQIGDYADQMFMTVDEMGASGHINITYLQDSEEVTSGTITIKSDLPASASIYAPDLYYTGTIKFEADGGVRKDIYGNLTFETFAGTIAGDDLSGTIDIERGFYDLGGPGMLDLDGSMSGTLKVNSSQGNYWLDTVIIDIDGSLTSQGQIIVYKGSNGRFDEDAMIDIGGDLAGTVFIGGDFAPGDNDGDVELNVGGDLSGTAFIGGDFAGDVSIGDDFSHGAEFTVGTPGTPTDVAATASFTVASNFRADLWVTGDVVDGAVLDLNKLGADGRILIDGECDGDILIAKGTDATSLIRITVGLTDDGLIVINNSEGNHNAAGGIYVGVTTICWECELPIVKYDGVIDILNGPSGGGDLDGYVTVVGCHLTDDPLELCVCGSVNGTTSITQTDCDPQVPGFTCSDNPCN